LISHHKDPGQEGLTIDDRKTVIGDQVISDRLPITDYRDYIDFKMNFFSLCLCAFVARLPL